MTHHETHGKNCICHSCAPKVIAVERKLLGYASCHEKGVQPIYQWTVEPRGARR